MAVFLLETLALFATVLVPATVALVAAAALHNPRNADGTPVSRSHRTFTEDLGSLLR